jgi:endonuclease/exonuclease/phosphatase family metal-dependent hydrolase
MGNNEKQKMNITLPNDNEEKLSILTLNTWGLPVWYGKSTDKSRYKKLIQAVVNTNTDIVCMQETFHPKIREYIQVLLSKGYYTNTDFTCNRYVNGIVKMDCYGGLITLTKYPIIKEKFYVYNITEEYSIIEKAGRKGFLFTTINVDGEYINIINTHLYSGGSEHSEKQRLIQIEYVDSVVNTIQEYKLYPTLFAGDFNFQHPSTEIKNDTSIVYKQIFKNKEWYEGDDKIEDKEYTYDNKYNRYASKKEKRQKLDYIFWNELCCNLTPEEGEVLYTGENSVSDHNGYKFTFHMNTERLNNEKYIVDDNK